MLRNVERRLLVLPERGVEIALLDFGGDGPPLLAHHANGFCAALFAPIAERLRDHFHVVAMDARGHGDSSRPEDPGAHTLTQGGHARPDGKHARPDADHARPDGAYAWSEFALDLGAVADRLADEDGRPVALGLGHSFGGTATLAAAALRPGRFERIVCVDPVVMPPGVPDAARASHSQSLVDGARRRRRQWPDRESALAHFRPRSLFSGWTERALALYVDEGLARRADGSLELKCPPEVEAAVFGGARGFDLFGRVDGLATPALILWARHGSFPRALYEKLVASMLDARVEDVDAGHLVTMEKPELVLEPVLRFCGLAPAPAVQGSIG